MGSTPQHQTSAETCSSVAANPKEVLLTSEKCSKERAYYDDSTESVLFSAEKIAEGVERLGREITGDYQGKGIVLVGLLKGAFMFLADLSRKINLQCEVDMMILKSYRGTQSTGYVRCLKDLDVDIKGKHVIIVEDLIDTGITLKWMKNYLLSKDAASVKLCCLFDKQTGRRTENIPVDYVGFLCPDEFIFGYGMDYDNKYRNMPIVGILHPKVYSERCSDVE